MEDVFDAAWREHPASHDSRVDAELASLIDIRGMGVLDDAAALRKSLLLACPDGQRHVDALLAALTAEVPMRLIAADDAALADLLPASVSRLQEHAELDAEWAAWAVRAWAHALALSTAGLDVVSPTSEPSAGPVASIGPARFDGVDRLGAGTIGGLWDRMPAKTADAPSARREQREPMLRPADPFVPARSEPGFSVDEAGSTPPTPPTQQPDHAPILVEPLFPDHPAGVEAPIEPIVAPTWVDHGRPADPATRSRSGPIAMGVVVLVVLLVAAIAWFVLEGTPRSAAPSTAPVVVAPSTPSVEAAPPPAVASEVAVPSNGATTSPSEPAPTPTPSAPAPTPPPSAVEALDARPVPVRRPAIVRIEVPSIVEGAPFAVGLQLGTSVRDVTSIERRVVDRSGAWPKLPTTLAAAGLRRAGDRTLLIPFRAMDAPARAVVEFVAVARDGQRSDAKRVAIAIEQPDPAIAALTATEAPVACTSATCGVVIESREIEPEVGTRGAIYQLSVRMDDRQIVTSTAPYRLQVGSRARLAGTRLVPSDQRTP